MSLKCVKSCLDYIFISGRSHQEVEGSVVELEATMLPSQRPPFKSVFQHLWTRCHWILWISMLLMRPQDDSQLCLSDKNSVFFNGNLRNLLLCLWQQQQKKDIFDRKLGRLQSCNRSGCFYWMIRRISSERNWLFGMRPQGFSSFGFGDQEQIFKAKTWRFPKSDQVLWAWAQCLLWWLGLHRSPLESDWADETTEERHRTTTKGLCDSMFVSSFFLCSAML